jgi:TPR repeat protein
MIRRLAGCALAFLSIVSSTPAEAQSIDESTCLRSNHGPSCRAAGTGYLSGVRGYPRDVIRGMQLLDRGCSGGDGEACYRVGLELAAGTLVARDVAAAAAYARGCAVRHASSCERAGEKYETLRNALEAVRSFERACDLGRPYACRALARKYDSGSGGVTMDKARAASYQQRACALADTPLARSFLCGPLPSALASAPPPASSPPPPSSISPEEAREACKSGDLNRCHLAALNALIARDYPTAMSLLEPACERKHAKSCDRLACIRSAKAGRATT